MTMTREGQWISGLAALAVAAGSLWAQPEVPIQEQGWAYVPLRESPAATPAPQPVIDQQALIEEQEWQRAIAFFQAIAVGDTATFQQLLNEGMNPDLEVPFPPPPELAAQFEDRRIRYYVSSEPGFTALMLASALGNESFVKMLLAAGAKPNKMTHRHKTFALWLAGKYGHIEIMRDLMRIGPDHVARTFRLAVSLAAQRATLFQGDEIVLETSISSGRKSHPTPTGRYVVTNKYKDWQSTLYDAQMPYYLRLSCSDFGLHAGSLPGYPASHGCVRLPAGNARKLFALVPEGTLVEIW